MIISVHIPKTAGRSFRALLQSHFKKHLKDDYQDSPLNKTPEDRIQKVEEFHRQYSQYKKYIYKLKGIKCIHGHFLPHKYNYHTSIENDIFVTWLREPMERLVSHYFYRKMMYEKTVGTPQQKIAYNYASFEEFCFSENMRNTYDKFFYKFPITNFEFIGIVEHFDEEIKYFAQKYLSVELEESPEKGRNFNKKKIDCLEDYSFIEKAKQFHNKDYVIYNRALELRSERIKKNN